MRILILFFASIMTGCATYNPYAGMSPGEKLWQAGHVVDTAQTISIAKDPICYSENNGVSRRVIGRKPNVGRVIAWQAATSYAHAAGSQWFEKTDLFSEKAKKLIRVVDIGLKINTVHNNYTIGLTFGTGNNHRDELCRSTR